MLFSDIIGQEPIKHHLIKTVENRRIPHAQLFIAPTGSRSACPWPLPMPNTFFVRILKERICQATGLCNARFEKLAHPDLHFVFSGNDQ